MSALDEFAFDANDGKPYLKKAPRPLLAVPLEKARRVAEEGFHAGTLAALDVVYLHDQEVVAAEIVNATDHQALLRLAVKDGYHNLAKLKYTIRTQNSHRRRSARGADTGQS